jgi:hypothetical protein
MSDETESPRGAAGPFLTGLLAHLRRRLREGAGRIVVLSTFGEVHDKLLAVLRDAALHVESWRGNARHLADALGRFHATATSVMLVDATSLDTRWAVFRGVAHVVVVAPVANAPLQHRGLSHCCQVRDLLGTCEGALLEVIGITALPMIADLPSCDNGCCPMLAHAATVQTV